MWRKSIATLCVGASLTWLGGCTGQTTYGGLGGAPVPVGTSSTAVSGYGVVQSVDMVPRQSSGIDLPTVGGALAGGVLGSQVGSGRGQTAATIAGAAGGALVGREVGKNLRKDQQVYRITLRMDNGTLQSVVQEVQPNVRIGDRVRVVNGVVSYS